MELAQPVPRVARLWDQRSLLVIIVAAVAAVTVLHYLTGAHLLEYHTVYRSLYYLPIAVAAVAFGLRGGLLTACAVILLYLPHVLGMGEMMPGGRADNLLELPVFLLVGGGVGALADRERTQRRRVEELRAYIDTVVQSLPVGVATARALLPTVGLALPLASLRLGYHTLEAGQRPLGLHVARLRDGATQDAWVYVLEDLTERRALEAQLRRNDRLASMGQLAAGVAHEVRNPLAIVRATAQLLAQQAGDNETLTPYTQVLTSEADRIERLISDLLAYARPRPPVPTALDLAGFLEAAAQQVRPYALQHAVQVRVEIAQAGSLRADEAQLGQALLNLLLNAVQASAPGSSVRLVGRADRDSAEIAVVDTGRGMAPERVERACDPFFTTRPEGTGLGLALVAAVVQEHGGTLQLDSVLGAGTIACIRMPQEAPDGARAGR